MTAHLFVGGVADGLWIEIEDDAQFHRYAPPFPQFNGGPIDLTPDEMRSLGAFEHHIADYCRFPWRAGTNDRDIFVLNGIRREEVLDMLLRGYRRIGRNTPR